MQTITQLLAINLAQLYKIEVKINTGSGNPAGYGFQLVGLIDANNSGLQNFPSYSANTKEVTGILDRKYYEHNNTSSSNVFTIDWIAPDAGTGSVTFYAVGNATNGTSSTGDGASNTTLTLTEGLALSNSEVFAEAEIQVLGNPASDNIELNIFSKQKIDATIVLYSITGKEMSLSSQEFYSGTNNVVINTENMPSGSYIVSVRTKNGKITKRILLLH